MKISVAAAAIVLALCVTAGAEENLLSNAGFKDRKDNGEPVGWPISKLDKGGAKGNATFDVVKDASPIKSASGKARRVDVIELSIDEHCQWVHLSQMLRDARITAGKTYRFSAWLKSD